MAASGAAAVAFATVTAPKLSEQSNADRHGADASNSARPAHHLNDTKSLFANPWPSYRESTRMEFFPYLFKQLLSPTKPDENVEELVLFQTPTWGKEAKKEDIKATWLGHACFLVELPTPNVPGAKRGARILFDPVFSHRCGPVQWFGPARYTKPPLSMQEIPEIDAVVISHNHYDHMDIPTLSVLKEMYNPHFFAPLNNEPTFSHAGIEAAKVHCLDWWEERDVLVQLPVTTGTSGNTDGKSEVKFRLTCTPSQHSSARTPFDRAHTLWSSWALEEISTSTSESASSSSARPQGFKVWFGGDTGYRYVPQGTPVAQEDDETKIPVCPAFKKIGRKFGKFDLALIPIGAYEPRHLTSPLHANPKDAVRIFKDIKAKKALGMHWGTWVLTTEPVMEPPRKLKEEVKEAGLAEDSFTVCGLGETVTVANTPS